MTDEPFDPKRARSKRPMPLWVDAFMRDTGLLEPDEVGAYVKILMAMWSSRNVALPNDPRKLARAAGVSLRLWNSRIGPSLASFWTPCAEGVTQKRLREEAVYVEDHCKLQSDKKRGACAKPVVTPDAPHETPENSRKPLKNNNPSETPDNPTDDPQIQPTQQPNNPTYDDDDDRARGDSQDSLTDREKLLEAMGHDRSGITAAGGVHGTEIDMAEARRWTELGLSLDQQIAVIREVMAKRHDKAPPNSFKFFRRPMQELAGALSEQPLAPQQRAAQTASLYPTRPTIDVAAILAKIPDGDQP